MNGLISQFVTHVTRSPFRILPNLFYALKIHFHHHRVNHDPDENSDRNRNAGNLKMASHKSRHASYKNFHISLPRLSKMWMIINRIFFIQIPLFHLLGRITIVNISFFSYAFKTTIRSNNRKFI